MLTQLPLKIWIYRTWHILYITAVCVTSPFTIPTSIAKARFLKAKRMCGLCRQALPPTPLTLGWDMKRDRVLQRKYLCVDTLKHTLSSSLFPFLSSPQSLSFSPPSAPHLSATLLSEGETFNHMKIDSISSLSECVCVNGACYISAAG